MPNVSVYFETLRQEKRFKGVVYKKLMRSNTLCYFCLIHLLIHVGGPLETRLLICRANQWTTFYMVGTFDIKELKNPLILGILCNPTPSRSTLEQSFNQVFPGLFLIRNSMGGFYSP